MTIDPGLTLVSGATVLLFIAVFLAGDRIHPLQLLVHDRRSAFSLGAGLSVAYVFVHLMPELHAARGDLAEAAPDHTPFGGAAVYLVALGGFLLFYGLDHLRPDARDAGARERAEPASRMHLGGFAAYVALMAYLLVRDPQESLVWTAVFGVTIAVHLKGVDHSLREKHGPAYHRIGRFVLAGASVCGWVLGLLVTLPEIVLAFLVAFIAGAIIVNSAIMELPSNKDGRFRPFMTGGLLYGALLVLVE